MHIRSSLLIFVALFGLSTEGSAQETREVAAGDRVRVQRSNGPTVHGVVAVATDSSLVLWQSRRRPPLEISGPYIRRVQVDASGPQYGRGLRKGLIIGAAIGGSLGLLGTLDQCDGGFNCYDPGAMIGLLAATGATIGMISGILFPPHTWTTVDVPTARVTPARLPDGRLGGVLSVSF